MFPCLSSSSTKYWTQAVNLSFFWTFLPKRCCFKLQLLILKTMSILRSSMALRYSQLPYFMRIVPSPTFQSNFLLTSRLNMALRISLFGDLIFQNTFQVSLMISRDKWLQPISGICFPTICLIVITSCLTILWFSEGVEATVFLEL